MHGHVNVKFISVHTYNCPSTRGLLQYEIYYNTRSTTIRGLLQWALVLTLRQLMLYIYMEHLFLMFLDHTQRRTTVGRTPLEK